MKGASDDPNESAFALSELAADQIDAQNSAAIRAAGLGVAIVQNRLQRIRLTGMPADDTSTLIAKNDLFGLETGGAASGDASFGRFGGFFNFNFNFNYVSGDEDETAFQPGYDFDSWAILGGLDPTFRTRAGKFWYFLTT